MPSRSRVLPLLVLIVAACSPAAPEEATPASTEPVAIREPTPAELQAAEQFGHTLERRLREGDAAAVVGAFDIEAIITGVCAGLDLPAKAEADFRRGAAGSLESSLLVAASQWIEQAPTFKRVLARDGVLHARFRFVDDDEGIAIIDYRLQAGEAGLHITDMHNQTTGLGMVEQARQAAIPMFASSDKGLLERLISGPGVSAADVRTFGELSVAFGQGDSAAALAAYAKLPPALRDTAMATNMHVTSLLRSGDEEAYAAAIRAAGERFPAPLFRFGLVDVHALEQDYPAAVACVDEFMAAVERDAALLALRALLVLQTGDTPAAHATLREALALEPDCEYAHLNGLDVLLEAGDHAAVRDSLEFLEGLGTYSFEGQLDDPIWAGFLEAPESGPWR